MQTYWASQSPVTDPGPAAAIDALPSEPAPPNEHGPDLWHVSAHVRLRGQPARRAQLRVLRLHRLELLDD
jgi:hypothetical protein